MYEPTASAPPPDGGTDPRDVGFISSPVRVPATAVALPSLSRQAVLARIGLLGIAAAALVAAALLLFSTSAAPNNILAAGSNGGSTDGGVDLLNGGPGGVGGFGGFGGRGGHGFGLGGITITAISGNNISLKTEDGWTRTITVDSGTTYRKSGDTVALGDLKVGDQVGFRQTLEDDGTWSIDSVVVILPHVGGEVAKVDGSTITVTQRDGTTATIKVNGQTDYAVNGDDSAALADVKVGMFLVAEGTIGSDGALTATRVRAADVSTFEGRRPGRGFHFGQGPDGNPDQPDTTAAPSATGSAT